MSTSPTPGPVELMRFVRASISSEEQPCRMIIGEEPVDSITIALYAVNPEVCLTFASI